MSIISKLHKDILRCAFLVAILFLLLPGVKAYAAQNVVELARTNAQSPDYEGELIRKNGKTMYQLNSGTSAKKLWIEIGGKVYHFDKKGKASTGFFKYGKKWYYANKKGVVYHGKWITVKGKKYYLKDNGIRATNTIVTISGKMYHFDKNGVLTKKCWFKYKKNWYYSKKNGVLARNKKIGIYYVGADGKRDDSKTQMSNLYLFAGDSRTVGMSMAVSVSGVSFVGKVGMGYSYLASTAGPSVRSYLASNPTANVVFNFGVNDLGNIASYISYYKQLIKAYPSARIFFMSVNPVIDGKSNASNSMIKAFNTKLKAAFPTRYVDTYSYMVSKGFSTPDGLHYTAATYQSIYKYAREKISNMSI